MRIAAVLALACAMLLAAGCGSDSDDAPAARAPVTSEDYARRGNEICRDAQRRVNALDPVAPPSLDDLREQTPAARERVADFAEYSRKVDEIGRESQRDLLAIKAPPDLRDERAALQKDLSELSRRGTESNDIGERLRAAARGGDQEALTAAMSDARKAAQRQATISDRVRRTFEQVGWTACSRPPQQ